MRAPPAKVPCTIITGFLGAGKTTLLAGLIAGIKDRRLGVIVNEFGDLGVDGGLLRECASPACPPSRMIELANGCICCTVADDFLPALETLLDQPEPPEHILIETSGLALPKPLVKAFDWPAIRARVTIDAVLAVADGAAVAAGRFADDLEALERQKAQDPSLEHDNPLEEVFEDQMLCADLVILNKIDLMQAAERVAVRAQLRALLPRPVAILEAEHGRLDPAVLIGLGAAAEDDLAARPSHHDAEEGHDHDDFRAISVQLPAGISPETLASRLAEAASRFDILRAKGFVAIDGKPMRLVVQAVGGRISQHFDRLWRADEARVSRLVVIGRTGFDEDGVKRLLAG